MKLVNTKVLEQPALIIVLALRRPNVDNCPIDVDDTIVNCENLVCILCVGESRVKKIWFVRSASGKEKKGKWGPMVCYWYILSSSSICIGKVKVIHCFMKWRT